MQVADSYVDFNAKDTIDAVKSRMITIADIKVKDYKNKNPWSITYFTHNEASFKDTWYTLGLFSSGAVEKDFMEYSHFDLFLEEHPDHFFGYTAEFKLDSKKHIISRSVYNVFEYISDIGGLQGFLDGIFSFII